MGAATQLFNVTNPYALARIVEASTLCPIVASQDIFDDQGVKLWARNQAITQSLQVRLLQRKLRQPLELCLRADGGITPARLYVALDGYLDSNQALASALAPWATQLREEVQHLPLHAVAQFLLSVLQATQPSAFAHALQGMALAGALQASVGGGRYELQLALLGGLLHDLGEMYIPAQCLDSEGQLDARRFRHVATHPRIGELLVASLTDYPPTLARAIGEHHERLDGSGYPLRRRGDAISPLGRLLCVTEATVGIVASSRAPLARASLALRLIPGEFDGVWSGFVSAAAQLADEELHKDTAEDAEELLVQLAMMTTDMAMTHEQAQAMAEQAHASPVVHEVAAEAAQALSRLREGWNALGAGSALPDDGTAEARFELDMAAAELRYRMRAIQRECIWAKAELSAQDAKRLEPLWTCLAGKAT